MIKELADWYDKMLGYDPDDFIDTIAKKAENRNLPPENNKNPEQGSVKKSFADKFDQFFGYDPDAPFGSSTLKSTNSRDTSQKESKPSLPEEKTAYPNIAIPTIAGLLGAIGLGYIAYQSQTPDLNTQSFKVAFADAAAAKRYPNANLKNITLAVNVAARYGIPPEFTATTALIEGGSNNEVSSTGCKGIFQFCKSTAIRYGLINATGDHRNDIVKSSIAFAKLTKDNAITLEKSLKYEPQGYQLYGAHQQGAGTFADMMGAPHKPITHFTSARNIKVNGGDPNGSAAKFIGKWEYQFNLAASSIRIIPVERHSELAFN